MSQEHAGMLMVVVPVAVVCGMCMRATVCVYIYIYGTHRPAHVTQ